MKPLGLMVIGFGAIAVSAAGATDQNWWLLIGGQLVLFGVVLLILAPRRVP